jgi:hypothetical protein
MSEPVKRVSYIIEQTPKDKQDWGYVQTHYQVADATQKLSFLRSTRLDLFWDFRLVRVEETRTVIE